MPPFFMTTLICYFHTNFINATKDAQKSAQEERIKAIIAARSQKMSQDIGSRQSSQLQSTCMQQQHQQQHQQPQQQHDPFYSVLSELPFQQLHHPSMQSTQETLTSPPPSFNSNTTSPTSFSSLLQDVRLSTNHYEADEFDSFEPLTCNLTSTPKVTEESFHELQKELCLLKTQVELLHDDVRHLKRKIKVNYNFYGIKYRYF